MQNHASNYLFKSWETSLLSIHSYSRCKGSFNTVEDRFGRICVANKMEGINLKVFNINKGRNE